MAELNFGLLNPPGSQSIGNAFVQGMDQAAVARSQENQNALSQYTLGKAKREDELTTKMLAGLQGATTIEQQAAVLRSVGKVREASELIAAGLDRQIKLGTLNAQPGAQAKTKAETDKLQSEARSKAIAEVASLPDAASANAAIDTRLANKTIDQSMADEMRQGLTPENFPTWKHTTLMRLSTPVEQLKQSVVKTKDTDRGGFIERQTYNAQGVAVGAPIILPKTPTPGSVPGIAQAATAAAIARDQGVDVPGAAPAPVTPAAGAPVFRAAAPAQPGTQVTQAAFPRDTAVQQTTRMTDATAIKRQELANEQIKLADATQKLATPAAANDFNIRKFYEERAKEATSNIATLKQELGGITNNLRNAGAAAPTQVVPNALIERSPKDQRDAKVVASTTTDSAGNIRRFNKFGEQIGEVIKGAGKPSATYEKTQALQKQLTQDLALTIRELESAVKPKGLIEQSTGSGAGALVDTGMGFFGSSTAGAQAVAALKPIYDRVLKIVPRFEGPQSNKDTQSYENAAGQLANPAVPNETKLVAAREILRLMKARQTQFISRDMVDLPNEPAGSTVPPTAPVDMPSAAAAEIARRAAAAKR